MPTIINVVTKAWVLISGGQGGQGGHANLHLFRVGGGRWMEKNIKCPPLFR